MGGHALKHVETVRLGRNKYEEIKQEVLARVAEHAEHVRIVRELPEKDSFGDLDVLIVPRLRVQDAASTASGNTQQTQHQQQPCAASAKKKQKVLMKAFNRATRNMIQSVFEPRELVSHGDVHSFDLHSFQIDMIVMPNKQVLDMADFYFAYSDVGGLVGRLTAAHGIKYGHLGLWIELLHCTVYPDNPVDLAHRLGRVHLTTDPREVCRFLGLCYDAFQRGFDTNHAIVEWIKTCRFFDPRHFQSLNRRHRHRAVTRPFYIAFVESLGLPATDCTHGLRNEGDECGSDGVKQRMLTQCLDPKKGELAENRQMAAVEFFCKQADVDAIVRQRERRIALKSKFSGRLFADCGLEKHRLAEAISAFKTHAISCTAVGDGGGFDGDADDAESVANEEERFDQFVVDTDAAVIHDMVQQFCASLRV